MKKIFLITLALLTIFSTKITIAGNDITVTCNSGSACTKSSNLPIFNETNIYPGQTISQKFYIDNNRNDTCNLTLKANSNSLSDSLSQKILINISGTNNNNTLNIINYPLSDLLDPSKPNLSLGHVNQNQKNSYIWTAVFNPTADNSYQNLTSSFNFNVNFECDQETTDNASNTSDNPSSNQGAANCTNSVPLAPTGLYGTRNNNGSVTLHWTQTTSDHTGYLIAFGTSPGIYQYGAPNVGNVDYYTVQGLTFGAQYCFYVRSLNGCMPGERTPEYCVNPGSNIPAAIPTIYQQQVLGTTTEPGASEQNSGDILGSQNSNCSKHWLPILFLVAFLINLIYSRFSTKYKLITLIISLATYLIDRYLLQSRCCFGPNWLCNYFWIGSILSWLVPICIPKRKKTSGK